MSFLDQLKNQAKALQTERSAQDSAFEDRMAETEAAGRLVLGYLQDLARQLSVIEPEAPTFTLDGKTPWPAMKQVDFRVDARRQRLRDQEVFDYVAMGWRVVPRNGQKLFGTVSVNFPTDMRRVEDRLAMGPVKHERREIRHPEKSVLQEVRYEYQTETRGSVAARVDHTLGFLRFRLLNTSGFGIENIDWPVARIDQDLLDELAKRVMGQQSRFV
jgi:hypothetical protein